MTRYTALLAICIFLTSASVDAQPISSTELINRAEDFDGGQVEFEGEVIGDVMQRPGHVLVNLHDGENAIGVWIPSGIAPEVSYAGAYNIKGDWLKVRGTFNRTCEIHGADLDIHAVEVEKIRGGAIFPEPLNEQKRAIVFILTGVLCLVLILSILQSRLNRK